MSEPELVYALHPGHGEYRYCTAGAPCGNPDCGQCDGPPSAVAAMVRKVQEDQGHYAGTVCPDCGRIAFCHQGGHDPGCRYGKVRS